MSIIAIFLFPLRREKQLYCPSSLDSSKILMYSSNELECNRDSLINASDKQMNVKDCIKFKNCIPCPSNGTCDEEGHLTCH
jgi:hypothetical protein